MKNQRILSIVDKDEEVQKDDRSKKLRDKIGPAHDDRSHERSKEPQKEPHPHQNRDDREESNRKDRN